MKEIDNINIISTRKGDKGYTKNYSNKSLNKTDLLFEALGDIDELSSSLGVSYHYVKYKSEVVMIQKDLQNIMSLIATNYNDERYQKLTKITVTDINNLENFAASLLKKNPLQPVFVKPGSDTSKAGSYLDLSRSISRRVERSVLRLVERDQRDELDMVRKYLNRLSDLLFIMARSLKKETN